MSSVQPLTPYQPTTSVLMAIRASPPKPEFPTTPSLLSTTPIQTTSSFSAIKQLPTNFVTAMTSQQATDHYVLTPEQKIEKGILNSVSGATLRQLNLPGQAIKPGAGDFIKQLQQATPSLPFTKTASNVLMSGAFGVSNPVNLINNVPAQIGAVANSIKDSVNKLTNVGLLTGKENATQIAGVVMAGATVGPAAVIGALSNPLSVASNIGGVTGDIAKAITSGNFAGGLADVVGSGLNSVASSISGVVSGGLAALSSGITNSIGGLVSGGLSSLTSSLTSGLGGLLSGGIGGILSGGLGALTSLGGLFGGKSGGIKALISSLSGVMQNAFNLAEKSFGELKANTVNVLGGLPQEAEEAPSQTATALLNLQIAEEDLIEAEQSLVEARKAYFLNDSTENLDALRVAEAKVAAAEQRVGLSENNLVKSNTPSNSGSSANLFGSVGAQGVTTVANAAASGLLHVPSTSNSGINAIPGGLGAFANQIGQQTTNIMGSIKNVAGKLSSSMSSIGKIGSSISGAIPNLANPASIVGNLVTNVQGAIGGITNNIIGSISNVAGSVGSLIGGASGALGALTGAAMASASGLMSSVFSAFGSLGNSPGQVKQAVLASNTYAKVKSAVNSTLNTAMDPKVPPPTFEEVAPKFKPDEYQQAQLDAQETITNLVTEREALTIRIDALVDRYLITLQPSVLEEVDQLRAQLEELDSDITDAQNAYERLIST